MIWHVPLLSQAQVLRVAYGRLLVPCEGLKGIGEPPMVHPLIVSVIRHGMAADSHKSLRETTSFAPRPVAVCRSKHPEAGIASGNVLKLGYPAECVGL